MGHVGNATATVTKTIPGGSPAPTPGAAEVPAVPHLTPPELEQLRQSLVRNRDKLLKGIASLESRLTGLNSANGRSATAHDGGEAGIEWERMLAMRSIADKRLLLNEIEQALQRIGKQTYGLDPETQQQISIERLQEIPWARS